MFFGNQKLLKSVNQNLKSVNVNRTENFLPNHSTVNFILSSGSYKHSVTLLSTYRLTANEIIVFGIQCVPERNRQET